MEISDARSMYLYVLFALLLCPEFAEGVSGTASANVGAIG